MLIILNRAAFVPARSFHKLCCCVLVAVSFVMVSIPAAAIDLRSATVQDINRAFDAGTLTSEELVRRYLASYMRGMDGADLFTHASLGKIPEQPYTDFLHEDSLRGARIGVLRDLFREGE